jgi:hypothetical protein
VSISPRGIASLQIFNLEVQYVSDFAVGAECPAGEGKYRSMKDKLENNSGTLM